MKRALLVVAVVGMVGCRPGESAGDAPQVAQAAPRKVEPAAAVPRSLVEFEAGFRAAVLAKDVEWILARMDPAGWQCGDAEMPASAYAETFRRGEMDYRTLFDLELMRRKGIAAPSQLSYREWFAKCPAAEAVEEAEGRAREGSEYVIRWRGPGCPEDGPALRIVQGPKGISISVFGGCL